MDRCGKLLVDIARLDIDSRLAKINEDTARAVNTVIREALTELGMSPEQLEAARPVIGRHLRLTATAQREAVALPPAADVEG